jgi:hypothetical protein
MGCNTSFWANAVVVGAMSVLWSGCAPEASRPRVGLNDNEPSVGSTTQELNPYTINYTRTQAIANLEYDLAVQYNALSSGIRSCLNNHDAPLSAIDVTCESTPVFHPYPSPKSIGGYTVWGECMWDCLVKVPGEAYIQHGVGHIQKFTSSPTSGC